MKPIVPTVLAVAALGAAAVAFLADAPADAPYLYHCHILDHEDCGMLGQFTVG